LTPYYEIHGDGQPLVLLHGSLGTIRGWGPVLAGLAEHRQVIAVELQGHGHTPDAERPLRYETLADDVAALIDLLGGRPVDVLGHCLGGGVALRLGIQHPAKVRGLVLVSTPYARTGRPDARPTAPDPSAQREAYAAVAPRPEDWPILRTKVRALLDDDYDWSASARALRPRTLLVYADTDTIPLTHAADFFALLGAGRHDGTDRSPHQLAVLPGTTHRTVATSPALVQVASTFLTSA
jgi:pimeloyl-ACP methyl ester carboxylesterase